MKVQLYVYDLSNGLAKAMSLPLTGKQIDGIWHTSVVAWNREVFYGQGIMEARPGHTHHGKPVQIVDCGETEIDEETFNEYIDSLKEHYTADAYHLLTFNCNSFTQDVVGFLTGGSIPEWISNLPSDFLSTPFGASLKPQIDAMFRRGPSATSSGASTPAAAGPAANPDLAATLLQAVAQQATAANGNASAGRAPAPAPAPSMFAPQQQAAQPSAIKATTSSLIIATNLPSFHAALKAHPCTIALFTAPATCPPCRVIDPVFTDLAESNGKQGKVAFVKVDMGVGNGQQVAGAFGIRATPTFLFFKDAQKVEEMKGAAPKQLQSAVEQFIDQCYPPHPHQRIYLGATNSIPLHPILPTNKPNYPALITKLQSFLPSPSPEVSSALGVLSGNVIPKLLGPGGEHLEVTQVAKIMGEWQAANEVLLSALKPEQSFPVIDLLVFGLSNPKVSGYTVLTTQTSSSSILSSALSPAVNLCDLPEGTPGTKPTLLTTLRLLQSACKDLSLARGVFLPHSPLAAPSRKVFLHCQLHEDVAVRNAAAGLAMDLAQLRHRSRKEHEARGVEVDAAKETDEDWELEFLSAVVESIERTEDEDILYRLVAALALQLWLSPIYEDQKSFLDVMEVKQKLAAKAVARVGGKPLVSRPEVKKLLVEVGEKLC